MSKPTSILTGANLPKPPDEPVDLSQFKPEHVAIVTGAQARPEGSDLPWIQLPGVETLVDKVVHGFYIRQSQEQLEDAAWQARLRRICENYVRGLMERNTTANVMAIINLEPVTVLEERSEKLGAGS